MNEKVIPKKEFWFYSVAAVGQGMLYSVMSSFASDFYVNVLQTPLIFAFLLILITRCVDAAFNPVMGTIVDRLDFKRGKMLPYIIVTALPIAALSFLMLFDPKLGRTGNMVFAAIVFILWTVSYTSSDVPFWTLPNIMTPHPSERAKAISLARTATAIGGAIPMAVFMLLGFVLPLAMPKLLGLELGRVKYIIIGSTSAVFGGAMFILAYFGVKERVKHPKIAKAEGGGNLKRVFKCKPLMLVILMGILSSGRYLVQLAAIHVARYAFYVGPNIASLTDVASQNAAREGSISIVTTIFNVCSAAGMMGAMLFMPSLFKKYNYKQIVIGTSVIGFLASLLTGAAGLLNIIGGYNWAIYACIPFIIIMSLPLGAISVVAYAMLGDSLDYLEWKTGVRDNALGFSCQILVNKLGSAFSTCLVILMYIAISINPTAVYAGDNVVFATSLAVSQRVWMFSLVSFIPGVSILLCALPIFFYDLVGEKKAMITRELAIRRANAAAEVNV